ncbi:Helicase PriA essential for oriC/DnaA-independent DNA replication [hydrothermal vent metagenome]|uniref:DNA 3'-5' helicase n=1 Tax=hydrothermal vent metagenome TaxID=652676 RepID=A0A3B0WWU5_9ZZZZ
MNTFILSQSLIVNVAVPGPFLSPLDYLYIESEGVPVVGGRVWVPFRNKKVVGLVMSQSDASDIDAQKIKPIQEIIDSTPLFTTSQLTFFKWASQYYHEPIGDVISAVLPKRLRMGEDAEVKGILYWSLTEQGERASKSSLPKNATRQRALFELFTQAKQSGQRLLSATDLSKGLKNGQSALKKLVQLGWIEGQERTCLPCTQYSDAPNHPLNAEQQYAVDSVVSRLQAKEKAFSAYLLQGITGSGKTEVYLGMIEAVVAQGKQVLVLVPEIGLTPQMVARFQAQLQMQVASLHSGLNDSERHCAWHLVRTGQVKVLLGTRSAVFTPFQNLGLCIIDEEHDLSYKQQEGFRYSARDLIVQRAFQEKVPVILGSATPSLESLHNVNEGRYQRLELKQRAGNASLPSLKLLDIRGEKIQEGVSRPLKIAIEACLEQGGQILLFLNRRGFAPILMCHECGWQANCPSCDANMTLHSGNDYHYLQCHHCAEQLAEPESCPSCGQSDEFIKMGQGTERLHETVQRWFPNHSVLRIDRDTTRRKGQMAELTGRAQRGEADILIGTQMLAKGHHFPNVTLVGLLDVDQGLFSADYRAPERMAQLIMQVAGRAGRAEKKGQVLIQTHQPDHPLFAMLITQGYDAFAQKMLQERVDANLPPHCYQILIRAEAGDAQDAMAFLQSLKAGLELNLQKISHTLGKMQDNKAQIEFWGPVSAPMLRRQGRYRFQLLVQATKRSVLHQLMAEMAPYIYKSPLSRKVRWSIDVDPQEMM